MGMCQCFFSSADVPWEPFGLVSWRGGWIDLYTTALAPVRSPSWWVGRPGYPLWFFPALAVSSPVHFRSPLPRYHLSCLEGRCLGQLLTLWLGSSSTEAGGQSLDDSCPGEQPHSPLDPGPSPRLRSLFHHNLPLSGNPCGWMVREQDCIAGN